MSYWPIFTKASDMDFERGAYRLGAEIPFIFLPAACSIAAISCCASTLMGSPGAAGRKTAVTSLALNPWGHFSLKTTSASARPPLCSSSSFLPDKHQLEADGERTRFDRRSGIFHPSVFDLLPSRRRYQLRFWAACSAASGFSFVNRGLPSKMV